MNKPNVTTAHYHCESCGMSQHHYAYNEHMDCCPSPKWAPMQQGPSARFTAIQQKLKECHELMDSIGSEPYIPSYRHTQMCFISDKLDNLQQNVHSLQMNLAHLG